MNGLSLKKNQDGIIITDVNWLYDPEFDKYNHIFNLVPRESFLTYILYLPDSPAFDDTISHYFEIIKAIKEDKLLQNVEIDDGLIEEVTNKLLNKLYTKLNFNYGEEYLVYLAWADNKSIVVYRSSLINEDLLNIKSKLKYNYKFIFYDNKDVLNSMDIIFNAEYWYKLLN